MKQVKKFETFEALKADEKGSVNQSVSLKKHNVFEQFVKSIKTTWANNTHSK